MTQGDKDLLLKDLCARLPYGVKIERTLYGAITLTERLIESFRKGFDDILIPYLRPMSSMTEEEEKDLLVTIVGNKGSKYFKVLQDGSIYNTDAEIQDLNKFNIHWVNFNKDTVTLYLDWLNAHYFDYRGLIEKGLAIKVTKENNPYKD